MRAVSAWCGNVRPRRIGVTRVVGALAVVALTIALDSTRASAHSTAAPAMPRITVRGNRLYAGHVPWRGWGFGWGGAPFPTIAYFDDPTPARLRALARQLRTAHRLGANTMRVFIELGQVMAGPRRVRRPTLRALKALLSLAEHERIYLDIAGNLVWRPGRVLAWYDALTESERWDVQARFWEAVAGIAAASPAVLCYELTSEPIVGARPPYYVGWVNGLSFVQSIADGLGRNTVAVARAWTRELATAVRKEDRRPVTIGFLPTLHAAIVPDTVGDLLDVIELHVYPGQTTPANAELIVRNFARLHKPVLIGETGVLFCTERVEREFLLWANRYVDVFDEWFDGRNPTHMRAQTIADALYRSSLLQFISLRPTLLHLSARLSNRTILG